MTQVEEFDVRTSDCYSFKLRPVWSSKISKWLWFISPNERDRWLIFYSTAENDDEAVEAVRAEVKGYRTIRLCLFIGEPWDVLEPAPLLVADTQQDFMEKISEKVYVAVMNMTLEQVVEQRGFDEAQTIADLGGGPGPSMN